MGYTYDRETRTFYPKPPSNEGTEEHGGTVWQVRYVVLCDPNSPSVPDRVMCADALCRSGDEPGYFVQVYRRQDPLDVWRPWPGRERECRTTDVGDPIPLEDVEDEIIAIIEEHYEEIARPEIEVAPQVNAVVNLPVVAATEDVGTVGFDIENPLPGSVEAAPEYSWTWSNGRRAEGPGTSYDGTDPLADPGHYPVRTTYARSGGEQVELVATWSITLTVDGIPPITNIDPLVYQASESFTVHSAGTVLVD